MTRIRIWLGVAVALFVVAYLVQLLRKNEENALVASRQTLLIDAMANDAKENAETPARAGWGGGRTWPEVTVRVRPRYNAVRFPLPRQRVDLTLSGWNGMSDTTLRDVYVRASGSVREQDNNGNVIDQPTLTVFAEPEVGRLLKKAETRGLITFVPTPPKWMSPSRRNRGGR